MISNHYTLTLHTPTPHRLPINDFQLLHPHPAYTNMTRPALGRSPHLLPPLTSQRICCLPLLTPLPVLPLPGCAPAHPALSRLPSLNLHQLTLPLAAPAPAAPARPHAWTPARHCRTWALPKCTCTRATSSTPPPSWRPRWSWRPHSLTRSRCAFGLECNARRGMHGFLCTHYAHRGCHAHSLTGSCWHLECCACAWRRVCVCVCVCARKRPAPRSHSCRCHGCTRMRRSWANSLGATRPRPRRCWATSGTQRPRHGMTQAFGRCWASSVQLLTPQVRANTVATATAGAAGAPAAAAALKAAPDAAAAAAAAVWSCCWGCVG